MKKKGFTLIELLAVIVILAIIALIAVPIIMNVVDEAKGGVYDRQRDMIADAAELYYFNYNEELIWEGNTSYVEIGRLKSTGYLRGGVLNPLNNQEILDETKVLIYKEGNVVKYSLQLYDNDTFKWYQERMVASVKESNLTLPTEIGQSVVVDLNTLIDQGKVAEFRIPTNLTSRCVGNVEIEKISDEEYEYNAYVDCLTNASTFASHYSTYGGKYNDTFNDVKETSDGGYVAVGYSNSKYIGDSTLNGKQDAIIVKYSSDGELEWSNFFGGSNNDYFNKVLVINDGYIVVGHTNSFDGDLEGLYNGGDNDAIIVKYDLQGELVYKRSYGSSGTNGTEQFRDIIKVDNGYIVVGSVNIQTRDGDITGVTNPGSRSLAAIIKFDEEFNTVWRSFFGGSYYEHFRTVKETIDGGYIVVGSSSSTNYDMTGLGWETSRNDEAIIVKYDQMGNLQYKKSFRGTASDAFYDVVEVSDGYVAVGYSNSIDMDMTGLNNGENGISEAVIVKYSHNLNLVWKKTFGGSNDDVYTSIVKRSDNEFVVVGYSKSDDFDLSDTNISGGGYSSGLIVKYNASGDILTKRIFGGTSSETFNAIIKTNYNTYILAGDSYSIDRNLQNFNKGNSDALLVAYDINLNLTKILSEQVVIIEKMKPITRDYGSSISERYDNIYTTNNPETDLGGWCTTTDADIPENQSNYVYGPCLIPLNSDDLKLLTNIDTTSYKRVLAGENEYTLDIEPDNIHNWHRIYMYLAGSSSNIEISNLKLKFEDGNSYSISEAVTNGYIEPLVTVSNSMSNNVIRYFPTLMDIINPGGTAGMGSYPQLNITIKPKSSRLVSLIFTASKNSVTNDGFIVQELRNFDMSIQPTN
jgi:prepilin-type N-terminal cleavage/methylation domain-containing protein